jgi:filamentous hemagglutinin family protein
MHSPLHAIPATRRSSPRLQQSLLQSLLVCLVTGLIAPHDLYAQVIASPKAPPNKRPHIVVPDRGPAVVQIAKPNQAGVSHNQYQQFNVDQSGVILSNNRDKANTQLRQQIGANPNLSNSPPANIILNEVISRQKSTLNGPIEVAGHKADVVISNPNGISVNGLSILNANRSMLTTGAPVFGGTGSLDTFRVTGGHINIEGRGMRDTTSSRTDIIARSVRVNAGIWAKTLTIVTGNNKVAYEEMTLRQIDGKEKEAVIALDLAELGGMYANKIRLIGTESGVGVKDYGEVVLSADDFEMSRAGKISKHTPDQHHIVKHDTSDNNDTSNAIIPDDVSQDVMNRLNTIDFPDDNAVTPQYRRTFDDMLASMPLPVQTGTNNTVNETSSYHTNQPIDLRPFPLVGGPFGLIPSPEQGAPLIIVPPHGHYPMAVLPSPTSSHALQHGLHQPDNAPSGSRHDVAAPDYGWRVSTPRPVTNNNAGTTSWSIVPVGEAPKVPLGVIPLTDRDGKTRLFLPPKVFGANLTAPATNTYYPQPPQAHDNTSLNLPGPSGLQRPHLDADSCTASPFSCTAGQPIPTKPSMIWPKAILNLISNAGKTGNLPPKWDLHDFRQFIDTRITAPHSHWQYNPDRNLMELRTRYHNRAVSVFFDPSKRRINSIAIPARTKSQPPVHTSTLQPSPQIEQPPHVEMINIAASPESSQIDTPDTNLPPKTPGNNWPPYPHDEF